MRTALVHQRYVLYDLPDASGDSNEGRLAKEKWADPLFPRIDSLGWRQ